MSCVFCEKEKNRSYLIGKHANYCLFCASPLHDGAPDPWASRDVGKRSSRAFKNAIVDESGRRICPNCGEVVRRSDPRAVYCSHACQREHASKSRTRHAMSTRELTAGEMP